MCQRNGWLHQKPSNEDSSINYISMLCYYLVGAVYFCFEFNVYVTLSFIFTSKNTFLTKKRRANY